MKIAEERENTAEKRILGNNKENQKEKKMEERKE